MKDNNKDKKTTTKKADKKGKKKVKAEMTIKSLVATPPALPKKKEEKKDPRAVMLHKAQKDVQKSLTGNGGKTAILDPATISVYCNMTAGVMVWNGIGYKTKEDDSKRKQPLSGGISYRPDDHHSIFKIDTIRRALGNGDSFNRSELFNV